MDIALDLFRRPLMARAVQRSPLPPGMLEVIKVAAGEPFHRDGILRQEGQASPKAQQAAALFLQHALFLGPGDDFRQLGLDPGADQDRIREHKRWLLKWLHPDRNPSKWESALFLRVSQAAERLEKNVEAGGDGGSAAVAAAVPVRPRPVRPAYSSARLRSPHAGAGLVAMRPRRRWRPRWRVALTTAVATLALWVAGVQFFGSGWRQSINLLMSSPQNWFAQ